MSFRTQKPSSKPIPGCFPFFELENKIAKIAEKYNATPAQINLAWLLHYNDLILPIPGTSKLAHFNENIQAFDIQLSEDDMKFLE